MLATNSAEEPGFEAKSVRECPEKSALAVAAAGLVGPGQALAISAGTTTSALATTLAAIQDITVVTNSVRVAEAFTATAGPARQTVVLTGGVRTPSDALVGPLADATIRSLHVDVLFLGVHGMDPVAGLTTPNLAEAETNRAFLAHAKKVIVVADHTKWRTVGLCTFGPLSGGGRPGHRRPAGRGRPGRAGRDGGRADRRARSPEPTARPRADDTTRRG